MKQIIIMLSLVVLMGVTVNANGSDTIRTSATVTQTISGVDTTYEVPVEIIGFGKTVSKPEREVDTAQVRGLDVFDWIDEAITMPEAQGKLFSFYELKEKKLVSVISLERGNTYVAEMMFWDNKMNPIQFIRAEVDSFYTDTCSFCSYFKGNLGVATWPDSQDWGNIVSDSLVLSRADHYKMMIVRDNWKSDVKKDRADIKKEIDQAFANIISLLDSMKAVATKSIVNEFPITEEELIKMVNTQLVLSSTKDQKWNSYDDHFTTVEKVRNGNVLFVIYKEQIIVITMRGDNQINSLNEISALEMWPKVSLGASRLSDDEGQTIMNHYSFRN